MRNEITTKGSSINVETNSETAYGAIAAQDETTKDEMANQDNTTTVPIIEINQMQIKD